MKSHLIKRFDVEVKGQCHVCGEILEETEFITLELNLTIAQRSIGNQAIQHYLEMNNLEFLKTSEYTRNLTLHAELTSTIKNLKN